MAEHDSTFVVVGTGVIGAGWAARALACGLDVVAWDVAPGWEGRLRAAVENAWPALEKLGLAPEASVTRLRCADSLESACAHAGFVQESAPERLELKRTLLARIDAATASDAPIASSTSGLKPSDLQADCGHPERVLVGHPFNPVYLLPLVEVVGGKQTAVASIDRAVAFYTDVGMHPLRVRNEIDGFLSDRLQEALWREALHLVDDDVATPEELDAAITFGPGLRWAFMGTFLAFHMAGGDAGMRHFVEQFGPTLKQPWTRLEAPELTAELVDKLVAGAEKQAAGRRVKELERLRDDCLVSIMEALRGHRVGAGATLADNQQRLRRLREG
ncbi:MAG: L-carnitine dehydrogenase [Gammaproteobacteria bacterium]|nr:L-carnitine dehydrogenase [Gammaproteobacteria bacterium]